MNSIKGKENPFARLQKGRLIQARLTPTGEVISLRVLRPIDSLSRDVAYFQVSKESGKFKHANLKSEIDAFPIASSAVIKTTLESAAVSANIPANVLAQIKERLSTSMDVNKGVAAGDSFSVIYERRQIDGADLGSGKLLAIEYFSKGKTIDSYWYEGEGVEGYFDSEGNNTDITFLRMPCEARVTSTFNRVRKHPVTGRLRPHWGVDLGAPRGTPVYAAGDGVISSKKYQRRGYGYWLELTHAGGYKSLYAHLSKYAPGMAEGVKVKKGHLIGYVGTSGMVTGPHLHYELKKDGQQINPLIADLRTGENLKDDALEDYKLAISPMRQPNRRTARFWQRDRSRYSAFMRERVKNCRFNGLRRRSHFPEPSNWTRYQRACHLLPGCGWCIRNWRRSRTQMENCGSWIWMRWWNWI